MVKTIVVIMMIKLYIYTGLKITYLIIQRRERRIGVGLFVKAEKSNKRLKIGLYGISGSGKTYTSLAIAKGLCPEGKRIAVLDTERSSASMYADIFDFDSMGLTNHHPNEFIRFIKAAEKEGYGVLIIDSLSHEWQGTGGYLDIMSDEQKKIKSGNTFAANRVPAELHKKLIDTILDANMHIICTIRAKKKYVDAVENGRTVKKIIGIEPITKDGTEFEFDIFAEMDADNNLIWEKGRIPELNGIVVSKPDEEFGRKLLGYLTPETATLPLITNEVHEEMVVKPRQRTTKPAVPTEPVPIINNVEPTPSPVGGEPTVEYLDKLKVDDLKAIAKQTGFNQAQFGMVLSSVGVTSIQTIPISLYNVLALKFKDKGLLLGL